MPAWIFDECREGAVRQWRTVSTDRSGAETKYPVVCSGVFDSLDAAEFEGEEYADPDTPETVLFSRLEGKHIVEALDGLSEVQKRRLQLLAQGLSVREIARREGRDIKTVRESIEGAKKKFMKLF